MSEPLFTSTAALRPVADITICGHDEVEFSCTDSEMLGEQSGPTPY